MLSDGLAEGEFPLLLEVVGVGELEVCVEFGVGVLADELGVGVDFLDDDDGVGVVFFVVGVGTGLLGVGVGVGFLLTAAFDPGLAKEGINAPRIKRKTLLDICAIFSLTFLFLTYLKGHRVFQLS